MGNMPDINKTMLAVRIPAELMAKLKSYAKNQGITVAEAVTSILHREYDGVPLTEEDFAWIRKEVEKNERARNRNR